MQVTLNESGIVTLDGSGNGTARVGPISAREVWHPQNVHVSVASNTNEAECLIYAGDSPIARNFRDGSTNGSTGDSTDRLSADVIKSGSYIFAVWTGGDAGAVATVNVTGTKDV